MGFHKNNNSQFLFWGRTINDLSSLHSLSTAPPASLSPPNAYTQYTYRHTFTHSFNNKKKRTRTENASQKLISKGVFIAFFHTEDFGTRCVSWYLFFIHNSMWTKCSYTHTHTFCSNIATHSFSLALYNWGIYL